MDSRKPRNAAHGLQFYVVAGLLTSSPIASLQAFPHFGVVQLYSGTEGTEACALLADHHISCWGDDLSAPTDLSNLESGFTSQMVTSITTGYFFTCALLVDKTVWCWGSNKYGQLGNGTFSDSEWASPVRSGTAPFQDVAAITAGLYHACALKKTDHTVWCWGSNSFGQLGNFGVGIGTNYNNPVDVVINDGMSNPRLSNVASITAGGQATCAMLNDDSGACWGNGELGQLGNGRSGFGEYENSPQAVVIPKSGGGVQNLYMVPGTLVTGGLYGNTCAAIPDSPPNSVACWGNNSHGATSTQDSIKNDFPESVVFPDRRKLTGVASVTVGDDASCALLFDQTVACWGANSFGEIGNFELAGADAFSPYPVLTTTGEKLSNVLQLVPGYKHFCVLMGNRTVKCWGDNSAVMLGISDAGGSSEYPLEVPVDAPIFTDDVEGS